LIHPSLVSAVQAAQRSNVLGDDLWKAWIEEFGQGFNDPSKYPNDFLLSFIDHAQTVQFTEEAYERLQEDIASGKVKESRTDRQPLPPAAVPQSVHPEAEALRAQIREVYRSAGTKSELQVDALLVKYHHALPELLQAAQELHGGRGSTGSAVIGADVEMPSADTDEHGTGPSMVAAGGAMVDQTAATDPASARDPTTMVDESTETDPAFTMARWIPVSVEDPSRCIQKNIFVSAPSWAGLDSWYTTHILELDRRSPGWTLHFVDDGVMENIIRAECSARERGAFFRLNPQYGPARADFLRYHLLRSRGGLWLDAKSGWSGDLDQNLAKFRPLPPLIFTHWGWPNQHENIPEDINNYGEIQNWMMISVKRHPCWNMVMGYVVRQIESYTLAVGVGKDAVLKITGPIALSRALYPLLPGWPHLFLKDTRLQYSRKFYPSRQRQY
jgi:hypothetical protein